MSPCAGGASRGGRRVRQGGRRSRQSDSVPAQGLPRGVARGDRRHEATGPQVARRDGSHPLARHLFLDRPALGCARSSPEAIDSSHGARRVAQMDMNPVAPRVTAIRLAFATVVLMLGSLASLPALSAAAGPRTCFGKHPTIVGTQHSDVLHGTPQRDVILGLGGNDHITAGEGPDFICAGSGDDNVHGAEGFNRMNGGPGNDWLDGRRGPGNIALGRKGDDFVQAEGQIDGGPGDDTVESFGYQVPSASPVPDVTDGGTGKDLIHGGSNSERLVGGADADRIFAGGGDDHLFGNGGHDNLRGEGGNDDISGGSGTDVCDQGPGTGTLTGCP